MNYQNSADSYSNVNAVRSVGRGTPQYYSDVYLSGFLVSNTLFDTGATFSMVAVSTLHALPRLPQVEPFESTPHSIIGVGGARATVRGFLDVPLKIGNTEVCHPLIVVEKLAFRLLVGMDILRPHSATVALGPHQVVQLNTPLCEVFLEPRASSSPSSTSTEHVATVVQAAVVPPYSAATIRVKLHPSIMSQQLFCVESLESPSFGSHCVVLPSVGSVTGATTLIAVVNFSAEADTLQPSTTIAAAIMSVDATEPSVVNSAATHRLSADEKLRKVLDDLKFDQISLDAETKSKLLKLIVEHLDIFAECDSDVGTTYIVFHEIDTGDSRPLRQPARRTPYGDHRTAIENEITKLFGAGIARPSTSPLASPVVMLMKKDGSWRMRVAYRRLNTVTKFDCFPLLLFDEAFDAFANCKVFSSLDLAIAYHQVPVEQQDIEKTVFITRDGLFKMAKMPFGLCNAPSTFQRLMSIVPRELIYRIWIAYLDDVIVFSKQRTSHIDDNRTVFF